MSVYATNPKKELDALSLMCCIGNINDERLMQAFEILDEHCFSVAPYRDIYILFRKLFNESKPIYIDTITPEFLRQDSTLPVEFLTAVPEHDTPSALHGMCLELKDKSLMRRTVPILSAMMNEIKDCQSYAAMSELISKNIDYVHALSETQQSILSSYEDAAAESDRERKEGRKYIPTGIGALDDMLSGGLLRKTILSLGAPPSCGKTQFALYLAYRMIMANPGSTAIIYSMEMSLTGISDRMDSIIIDKRPELISEDERRWLNTTRKSVDILISDKKRMSVDAIRATSKRIARKKDLSVIVIDYLDLVQKPDDKSLRSDEKIAFIASSLHDLAKELNCVVIVLTQLNKEAIKKPSKRPSMNDAKNSNATAEASDYWVGLKRIGQWDLDRRYADSHLFEIIIDKNRHGDAGIVYVDCSTPFYAEVDQRAARDLVAASDKERNPGASFNKQQFVEFD